MTIDARGNLWVAHWGGGRVTCYDPVAGRAVLEVRVPGVSRVTSCAFGGCVRVRARGGGGCGGGRDGAGRGRTRRRRPDLKDLYITTAWVGLDAAARGAQPTAGDLFVARHVGQGVPAVPYSG